MGKTSLALQYAKRLEKAYEHGFVFIDAQSVISMESSLAIYVSKQCRSGRSNI